MDAMRKIERFDWDSMGMLLITDGDYMRADEVLQTLASKEAELVRLRELLAGCRTVFALALDNGKGEQYASLETRRGSFVHCVELMQDLDAALTQPPKEPT